MRRGLRVCVTLVMLLMVSAHARAGAQDASFLKDDTEVKAALLLLEAQLAAFWQEQGIPALSVALVYDQEVLWANGFGYTDLEGKIPATPQTVYRVHSITKLFTATMLLQLRDQGKLQLDDPLSKYLPGFGLKSRFGALPPVTLRQLASHTAGVPRFPPPVAKGAKRASLDERLGTEAFLATLKEVETTFPPLTEWKYSDLGYALLGYALSRIAGQPYDQYVQEHILRPLGMNHSGFVVTPEIERYVRTADRRRKGESLQKVALARRAGLAAPAFGLYSSVEDMARFISLQFRDENEPAGGAQILRGSSVREMRSPQWLMEGTPDGFLAQGVGFRIFRLGNNVAVGHGGGYRTTVALAPRVRVGVAVFTNGPRGEASSVAAQETLKLMIPVIERATARQKQAAPTMSPQVWQKYVGLYVAGTGHYEIRLVNDRLVLADAADPAIADTELVADGEHRFRTKDGYYKGELVVFEIDPAGKIVGMRYADRVFTRK